MSRCRITKVQRRHGVTEHKAENKLSEKQRPQAKAPAPTYTYPVTNQRFNTSELKFNGANVCKSNCARTFVPVCAYVCVCVCVCCGCSNKPLIELEKDARAFLQKFYQQQKIVVENFKPTFDRSGPGC